MRAWYWAGAIAALLLLPSPPCYAQDASAQEAVTPPVSHENETGSGDIIVIANPDGTYRIDAERIREMVQAFVQHRSRYAPAGELFLRFRPSGGASPEGLIARFERGDQVVDLDVDSNGTTTVPVNTIANGQWQLVVSRALGEMRITPTVYSPGTTETERRFGDLRLQCRVLWGYYNNEYSVFIRGLYDLIGGCTSSRAAIYYRANQPIESATVTGRSEPLDIRRNGESYHVPLSERAISDEARLRIVYR